MTKHFVVGGEYTDFDFKTVKEGKEVKFGPFETEELARECWKDKMWLNVDNALYKLRIQQEV